MDIYEYIKADHKKVANLFLQFEKALSDQQMFEIVGMIQSDLLLHAESEQNTFYKAIENHAENTADIKNATHEHQIIFKLLAEINSQYSVNDQWKKLVYKLKDQVDNHVKEEEGKIFNEAKKIFTPDEAWMLKERMHDFKEKMREKMTVENAVLA